MDPTTDKLLTDRDVAAILKVSPRTVHNWADKDVIPAPVKIGTQTRWRSSEIQRRISELARAERKEAGR